MFVSTRTRSCTSLPTPFGKCTALVCAVHLYVLCTHMCCSPCHEIMRDRDVMCTRHVMCTRVNGMWGHCVTIDPKPKCGLQSVYAPALICFAAPPAVPVARWFGGWDCAQSLNPSGYVPGMCVLRAGRRSLELKQGERGGFKPQNKRWQVALATHIAQYGGMPKHSCFFGESLCVTCVQACLVLGEHALNWPGGTTTFNKSHFLFGLSINKLVDIEAN